MSKKANKGELSPWTQKVGKVCETMLLIGGVPARSDADNVIKFHFNELDEKAIQALSSLSKNITVELRIKRSGTGLTVLTFL